MTCLAHQLAKSRGMLIAEDVDLIRELTRLLPIDRNILVANFGSGSGTTALAVFAERQENIHMISVDIDPNLLRYCREVVEYIGCTSWHTIFAGDTSSPNGEEEWELLDAPIDLLLIDTSHELEATRRELALWLPKLRKDGFLWMHDYERSPYELVEFPNVKKATDEVVAQGSIKEYKKIGCSWAGQKL